MPADNADIPVGRTAAIAYIRLAADVVDVLLARAQQVAHRPLTL